MTTNKDPDFSIHIRGIDYSDAVALCGSRWAAAASTWCDEDGDDQGESCGNIGIPLANFSDLIDVCRDIANAGDWTDTSDWDVSLHVNRMAPNYNIVGHLAESGASLVLMPCRPANKAVDEALSRMQLAIADARAAACLLEGPTP
jgi:hypothetical protein